MGSIEGFGLSPGITKEQRLEMEGLMKTAFSKFEGDLSGEYFPLTGMDEAVRQQLVDDHFLFMSGDPNLKVAGMERDWPEGRGIFHNKEKTFLVWVNEEDQMRVISMQKGGDVVQVFQRWVDGVNAVEKVVKGKGLKFMQNPHVGMFSACVSNLGTGLRASMHVLLPKMYEQIGIHAMEELAETMEMQ